MLRWAFYQSFSLFLLQYVSKTAIFLPHLNKGMYKPHHKVWSRLSLRFFFHLLLVPMFPTPRSLIVKVAYSLHKAIKATWFLLGDLVSCRCLVLTCSGNTHMVHRILRYYIYNQNPQQGSQFLVPHAVLCKCLVAPPWSILHCSDPQPNTHLNNLPALCTRNAQAGCDCSLLIQHNVFYLQKIRVVDVHVAMDWCWHCRFQPIGQAPLL